MIHISESGLMKRLGKYAAIKSKQLSYHSRPREALHEITSDFLCNVTIAVACHLHHRRCNSRHIPDRYQESVSLMNNRLGPPTARRDHRLTAGEGLHIYYTEGLGPAHKYEGIAVPVEAGRCKRVHHAEPTYPIGNAETSCKRLKGPPHRSVAANDQAQSGELSHCALRGLEQIVNTLLWHEVAEGEENKIVGGGGASTGRKSLLVDEIRYDGDARNPKSTHYA